MSPPRGKKNETNDTVPNVSPGDKKRPPPARKPTGRIKQTDYTNETVATKLKGGLLMINTLKPDGEPAFKRDINQAFLEGKVGTLGEVVPMAVVNHKKEPTVDSEPVTVGKNNVPDKVVAAYYQQGDGENEAINIAQQVLARAFEKYTKPYKSGSPKPKARGGKLVNPNSARAADEMLYNKDIANIFVELYDKDTLDDDDIAEELLSEYFSLISFDEAKEIVLEAFARKNG